MAYSKTTQNRAGGECACSGIVCTYLYRNANTEKSHAVGLELILFQLEISRRFMVSSRTDNAETLSRPLQALPCSVGVSEYGVSRYSLQKNERVSGDFTGKTTTTSGSPTTTTAR